MGHLHSIFFISILFSSLISLPLSSSTGVLYDHRPLLMNVSSLHPRDDPFPRAINVGYDGRALTINSKRRIIFSGAIHYPRSTPRMWPELVRKAKEGGIDAIETYVFWNAHEPQYRQYDFTGNLDLVAFLKTIQNAGLYAILRIGPYVCAEWNYGISSLLHNLPGIKFRTNNQVFEQEMRHFTSKIVDMVKHAKLFASQGGPIILAQIENEYGNVMGSMEKMGKSISSGVQTWLNPWTLESPGSCANRVMLPIPWYARSAAKQVLINTCNGWYCDQFKPKNDKIPKMWTENWTGWFKNWGGRDPHRTAEDLAFSVARFFQTGGTLQSYYMYHGGTNFGRTAGGPYITTTYDYDAPLDEYGNLNQPKWGHLKLLHEVLHKMENVLTHGDAHNEDHGNQMFVTTYTYKNKSSFIGNANNRLDFNLTLMGNNYTVPAWSVSILPDCKKEVYNTAKVNVQTSVMVKKENEAEEEEPYSLEWQWRGETLYHLNDNLNMEKTFVADELLEHKAATNDTSDFLYYMTKFQVDKNFTGPNTKLSVQTNGHVLHVYVNERHIGTQWGYKFTFEKNVRLTSGNNTLTLISATVGLQNYGGNFDTERNGILGPVHLTTTVNNQQLVQDLSTNKWVYKVGLSGEEQQLYNSGGVHGFSDWHTEDLPINRKFVWYKTTFRAPLGEDPVVVDLLGMGKGTAWVNGQSLGRYWPSSRAPIYGCDATCDYRGAYNDKKCVYNCGNPTQRWYHVPRSFLRDGDNTLVLLEEFGGNPSRIGFKTITVGKICAHAYEGHKLELQCQGDRRITRIKFASFGNPAGSCGSFEEGECGASKSKRIVQKRYVSGRIAAVSR